MDFTELRSVMPVCPGCRRACPVDDLQCDRGKDIVNKILAGEASPEDFRHHGPHSMPFREGERPDFPQGGPRNMPFRPHERGFGKGGPGRGPRRMPEGPQLPRDDSLESLLFFAAHAVRPRHTNGPGMAQTRILRLLSETGSISQQSLQEILAIRPGSLSELLGKLTQKGLIERKIDENDKRKNTLTLTDEGKDYVSRMLPKSDPFDVLTEEEQEALKALLKKLLNGNAPAIQNEEVDI